VRKEGNLFCERLEQKQKWLKREREWYSYIITTKAWKRLTNTNLEIIGKMITTPTAQQAARSISTRCKTLKVLVASNLKIFFQIG